MKRRAFGLAAYLALACWGCGGSDVSANDRGGGASSSAGSRAEPAGAAGGSVGGLGGLGGATGAGVSGAAPESAFQLLFRDDFDTIDPSRWQLMTHSWSGNLALFSASAALVSEGALHTTLTPAPAGTVDSGGTAKSFLGAEVRSLATLTYGRVRARAKLASGSAVVSSIVTIYTPWPADNWNELDIEHLGAKPNEIQLNAMVYTGPALTPPVTQSVTPTQDPLSKTLAFDAGGDFHVYTIEWTPAGARFLVDDELLREWQQRIELMTLPQNVLLTIWASGSSGWAGPVTEDTGKAEAVYDWVELYQYQP